MSDNPVISVRGVGRVTVPPDMTGISFQMSALDRVYEKSVGQLNQRVDALRQALHDAGVEPGDLKTTRFDVEADYTHYQNRQKQFNG